MVVGDEENFTKSLEVLPKALSQGLTSKDPPSPMNSFLEMELMLFLNHRNGLLSK
jgi:hypothetical protein